MGGNESDFEELSSLSQIMRGYQRNGFNWLKLLESYSFGVVNAAPRIVDMSISKV